MSRDVHERNPYQSDAFLNGESSLSLGIPQERVAFVRRTYAHLLGAIAAFIAIEALLLTIVPDRVMAGVLQSVSGYAWIAVLAAFMGVSWLARWWAESGQGKGYQYAGLSLYVVAEAVIFLPLLFIASRYFGPEVIPTAGLITGLAFMGLTAVVFATKADLHWMGKALCVAGLVALGVVVASVLFGFNLGILFSGLMVALAAGYIAYDTSNVVHHYRTDQHVAAALALFASVALLFWYVLRLVMAFSSDD